jgi:putative transposase
MPSTYSKILIHAVFSVKYRNALINLKWKHELYKVIGNLINETGCTVNIVNGVEDHVHCLFIMKPTHSISKIMQSVKAKSSKWVNENKLTEERFEWQVGFGAFSVSHFYLNTVYNYILNQEKHHSRKSFVEEHQLLLKIHNVDLDEFYNQTLI